MYLALIGKQMPMNLSMVKAVMLSEDVLIAR
jgi:hypothetical protein